MLIELILILLGAFILTVSLAASLWLLKSIKGEELVEKWTILQVVLFLVIAGFGVLLLYILQFGLDSFVSYELLASITLFLASLYVGGVSYMLWRVMRSIYGTTMSDKIALNKFLRFASLPAAAAEVLMDKHFDMTCEVCDKKIEYTIQDVVRSHPELERGIEIEDGLGERNFTFYVRHDCTDHYREIPVQHDKNMVPRAQKESREVVKF